MSQLVPVVQLRKTIEPTQLGVLREVGSEGGRLTLKIQVRKVGLAMHLITTTTAQVLGLATHLVMTTHLIVGSTATLAMLMTMMTMEVGETGAETTSGIIQAETRTNRSIGPHAYLPQVLPKIAISHSRIC